MGLLVTTYKNRTKPLTYGLKKRKKDLLPVGYFHIVFTIPEQLKELIIVMLLNILMELRS